MCQYQHTAMSSEKTTRPYTLRKRADAMAATRERITEAAMDLHGSVGPSRTTITAVAERAGVQRQTVYRHFATEADLSSACSGHFAATHPVPDAAGLVRDRRTPEQRLARALDELYAFYEGTEAMWTNIFRDEPLVPAIGPNLARFRGFLDDAARALAEDRPGPTARCCLAATRHAVDFRHVAHRSPASPERTRSSSPPRWSAAAAADGLTPTAVEPVLEHRQQRAGVVGDGVGVRQRLDGERAGGHGRHADAVGARAGDVARRVADHDRPLARPRRVGHPARAIGGSSARRAWSEPKPPWPAGKRWPIPARSSLSRAIGSRLPVTSESLNVSARSASASSSSTIPGASRCERSAGQRSA